MLASISGLSSDLKIKVCDLNNYIQTDEISTSRLKIGIPLSQLKTGVEIFERLVMFTYCFTDEQICGAKIYPFCFG